MRLILKKHTVKRLDSYTGNMVKDKTFCALVGEKGELTNTGKGQIGDKGTAGVLHTFKAFDPMLEGVNILVHSVMKRKGLVEIVSANGNTFIFESIE